MRVKRPPQLYHPDVPRLYKSWGPLVPIHRRTTLDILLFRNRAPKRPKPDEFSEPEPQP